MTFDVYEFSNQGGRSYNEDAIGSIVKENSGIFVVADGLGGHSFGELASACALDTMLENWKPEEEGRDAWLEMQSKEANQRILKLQEEKKTVLKSTVVALAIDGTQAVWAHVGDSRLYYLHHGWIHSITEDHSVAYKKYKAGEITREAIAWDEDQSCLLRTLGGTERYEAQVCVCEEILEPGDAFLLCSDGAWEYLRDGEIPIDLLKAQNAKQWTELMLLRMMDRINGDNDNLSMLTVMLKE